MGSFTSGAGTSYLLSSTAPVPSGTANGVLYLNGSKVVTSGSGLTFDGSKLSVGAGTALNVTGYNNIVINGSTGGLLELKSNDTRVLQIQTDGVSAGAQIATVNNGGDPPLIFGVNSTEQMRLTSTGLGIGTSSPAGKLDVREANRANSTNITNIGVYTTTAQAADVGGTIGLGGIFDGVSGYAPFGSIRGGKENSTIGNYAGYLAFQTIPNAGALSERMRLDSSGNLGLGVTPSAWGTSAFQTKVASVWGFTNNAYVGCNYYFDGTDRRYIATATASEYAQFNGQHTWYTAPSGTAGNAISFTQAMTLDASGNLGVGTTNPSQRLDVRGSVYVQRDSNPTNALAVQLTNQATVSNNGCRLSFDAFNIGSSALGVPSDSAALAFYTGGVTTERARIPAAGGMVVGTAALATSATDGFLYVPTCAGTPTGTPTTQTGTAPIVVDTTNNKLYFYSGGAWRDAGP